MKSDQAIVLMNELYNDGYDASIDDDYSGRGMYGKTTHSVTSNATPQTVAHLCGQYDLPIPRSDNMGMDYVYY